MMFACAVVIMVVGLLQNDPRINFAVSFTASLFMLLCCSICLTPLVAKVNAFAVLYTGLNASISGATFYFYTDSKEVYPAGPHFLTSSTTPSWERWGVWSHSSGSGFTSSI